MFHPIIQNWFTEKYGGPTDIQNQAWPRIATGENLLITAPTGSGKTLTAFLWALNQFINGELDTGSTKILYISPLKALNNDIQKNLLTPLSELMRCFEEAGEAFPDIRVQTRSGDTATDQRRRMLKNPPEILITTPESLNLLLSSQGGRGVLHDISTVILDEIHAVVSTKRGTYLMTAIERLVPLSGEFQRIGVSATINPLETVADFIAGYSRNHDQYNKRQIAVVAGNSEKRYEISIVYPDIVAHRGEDEKIWDYLAQDLLLRINANSATLVFVNSRVLAETLTLKINNSAGEVLAYAHHGSLSREIREDVETRLKNGQLRAIVATSSLEMGIDIGSLDEVVLVQSPGSIASSIQRIGRAGHQVGATSRCAIYPTHPRDFIEAAVLAEAVQQKSLEPVQIIEKPLDVLSQVVISMTGTGNWDINELFAELKRSTPYRHLSRREFDLVIDMLHGRYAGHHIRELKPRVRIDQINNRIEARRGALLSLYLSGGVIPDRGYFQLRHENGNARIGELDEEFVWEARVGQVFSFGTQTWQVKKITHNDVLVSPGHAGTEAPPFWKSESISRSFHYAERINKFLETANARIADPEFRNELITNHATDSSVADEIINLLRTQREHVNRDLPHRHHLLIEHVRSAPGGAAGHQIVVHTGWGAMVNRPFAMSLESAWKDRYGEQPEIFVTNDSLVAQLTRPLGADELLSLVPVSQIEDLLRSRLESSGFFGARFRENAGRALLLSKGRFNERKPLWMSRLQSQKLMDSVLKFSDFPILLESWRTCMRDEFDIDSLRKMLTELETRDIIVSEAETSSPSPFARSAAWDQINTYMYMSDAPKSDKQSKLNEDLLREVVFSPGLRPSVTPEIARSFLQQRQRLDDIWLPTDVEDLDDWIKERSVLPLSEWIALLDRLDFRTNNVIEINNGSLVAHIDDAIEFDSLVQQSGLPENQERLETLIANWMQYYGPMTHSQCVHLLQIDADALERCLLSLTDNDTLISGQLIVDDHQLHYCDAVNFEYLLRQQRASQRSQIRSKPLEHLPAFLMAWQTRYTSDDPLDQLYDCLERLRGLPVSAELWESDVLPARLSSYDASHLDLLLQEGEFIWIGMGEKRVAFTKFDDLDLISNAGTPPSALIENDRVRYEFNGLQDETGRSSIELTRQLWEEVWATKLTNNSMRTLRQGIATNFQPPDTFTSRSVARGRRAFNKWRAQTPQTGSWFRLPQPDQDLEHLEKQETDKDRARLLLNRYGILFRELYQREQQHVEWRTIFRALRLMELSGEVTSGHFFESVPGPQFATRESLRTFQNGLQDHVFLINATDPISPSGLGLGLHGKHLPRRVASNYLIYHDTDLVMTLARRGRDLTILVEPEFPELERYLGAMNHLLYRPFGPEKKLILETINGESAASSPYLKAIEHCFKPIRDHKSIIIQREI